MSFNEDWRNANIASIHKKGDVHLAENYRPVSLTSQISKLLEHIICKHLLDHLDRNNILTQLNHGFRKGFSCETQLIVTMDDLLKNFDNNTQTDIIILDFSKAFDTVPHDKLLLKLGNFGIDGNILDWLKSFLTERKMRTVVEGEMSDYVYVDSGVPQGTVLGPLLFLCNINDLPSSVTSQVRLFADDCLLYRPIRSFKDHLKLQNDLHHLESWASKWGMQFNSKKCYVMSSNSKSSCFHILCMDKNILQHVNCSPYLGVNINDDFKWNTHINKITSKASSVLGLLRRNLKYSPKECKRLGYLSMVRSNLEYASIVWSPYHQQEIDSIEKIQRKAARFISGNYISREEGFMTALLKELDLPTLESRRKASRLCFLYKIIYNKLPSIKPETFLTPRPPKRRIKPTRYHNCDTLNILENQCSNNSRALKYLHCKTQQYNSSFFPSTIIQWNQLPEQTVNCETLTRFRTHLPKFD